MPVLRFDLDDSQRFADLMRRRDQLVMQRQHALDHATRLERRSPSATRFGKTAAEWRAYAESPEVTAEIDAAEEACRSRFAEWLVSTYPAAE